MPILHYMELFIYIITQPAGIAAAGVLAVFGLIWQWHSKQRERVKVAYSALGFTSLKPGIFRDSMNIGEYKLLRNVSLAFVLYSKPFAGAVNGRHIVQCLRSKLSLYEKHCRFTTITQCETTIPLPAFSLKPALKIGFSPTREYGNRIVTMELNAFSEAFELSSNETSSVMALFSSELCKVFLNEPGIHMECSGNKLIVFQSGQRVSNESHINKLVHNTIKWVEILETAQSATNTQWTDDTLKVA